MFNNDVEEDDDDEGEKDDDPDDGGENDYNDFHVLDRPSSGSEKGEAEELFWVTRTLKNVSSDDDYGPSFGYLKDTD